MSKDNIKIFCLILFIYFPSVIFGQTNISNEERTRLEEKFKDLKTFYIDKDGLVVYTVPNKSDSIKTAGDSSVSVDDSRAKVTVSESNRGEYVVTTEETEQPVINYNTILAESEKKSATNLHDNKLAEGLGIAENNEATVDIAENNVEVIDTPKDKVVPVSKKTRKKEVQPKKSADTTIAELDDLIGELRAQQNQSKRKNSNSMSNVISGSVDGSLRQKYSQSLSSLSENDINSEDSYDSENTNSEEPIYYIDGVRVSVEEFMKLNPESIRRKYIRRSNNNSQGEWWIQTK